MAKTVLLDTLLWDLVVGADGNIAVASDPYALAQDAASAIRTFLGEVYYDSTQGVAYSTIMGQVPALSILKQQLVAAALTVPGVTAAQCFISGLSERKVSGQVQTTNAAGTVSSASF